MKHHGLMTGLAAPAALMMALALAATGAWAQQAGSPPPDQPDHKTLQDGPGLPPGGQDETSGRRQSSDAVTGQAQDPAAGRRDRPGQTRGETHLGQDPRDRGAPGRGFGAGRGPGQDDQERQAWLGIVVSEEDDTEGVKIDHVFPTGPAARGGLHSGDVITGVNDQQITSAEQLSEAIAKHDPGKSVEIKLKRDDDEETRQVRLGNRSDFLSPRMGFRGPFGPGPGFPDGFGGPFEQGMERDDDGSYPEHLMRLEFERCMAEQNERLEGMLEKVLEEVSQLRQEVQQLRGNQSGANAASEGGQNQGQN